MEETTVTPYHILRAAALVWIASTSDAMAVDYVVRWTAVEHDVTPAPQMASQGYVARFSFDGSRFVTDEGGRAAETVAGQPAFFTTKLGTPYAITYTLGDRSIVRTDAFPGFSVVMRIESDGEGGCHAVVRYRKPVGHAVFESKRNDGSGPSSATKVEATTARCVTAAPQS